MHTTVLIEGFMQSLHTYFIQHEVYKYTILVILKTRTVYWILNRCYLSEMIFLLKYGCKIEWIVSMKWL